MIDPYIARLDYPNIAIKMRVTAPVEQAFRINASQKEPWTIAWLESLPKGSVVYDLGANVGSYTLLAVALGHQVVACEPSFQNYNRLCENLQINNWLDKAVVMQVAIAGQSRLDWMQYSDMHPGAASHVIGQPPGQRPIWHHRQVVPVWRLDDLIKSWNLPPAQHIKIDIDGGESQALAGMVETLKGVQSIMAEVKPDQEPGILAHLSEQGFDLKARFDQRNGKPMGVLYCEFRRRAI